MHLRETNRCDGHHSELCSLYLASFKTPSPPIGKDAEIHEVESHSLPSTTPGA